MGLLARSWLVLSIVLIPPGSFRWSLLSFYFNPLWFFPCQVFLWFKVLITWVILILFLPFKTVILYLIGPAYRFVVALFFLNVESMTSTVRPQELIEFVSSEDQEMNSLFDWYSDFEPTDESTRRAAAHTAMNEFHSTGDDRAASEAIRTEEDETIKEEFVITKGDRPIVEPARTQEVEKLIEEITTREEDLETNDLARREVQILLKGFAVLEGNQSATEMNQDEVYDNRIEDVMMVESITDPVLESVRFNTEGDASFGIGRADLSALLRTLKVEDETEADQFYQAYGERMAQFDRVTLAKIDDLRKVMAKLVGDSNLPRKFACIEPILLDNTSWSKSVTKRFVKDIETQLEMFYVGQCCLCWDSLQYQYMKIREMASSSVTVRLQYDKLSAKFQHFKVLLERFMEDEHSRGERFWNYSQSRLISRDLLLVPPISVEPVGTKVEAMPTTLLKILEETIMIFLNFLANDNKRASAPPSKWLLWTVSQVEDANDLEMLSNIQKTLRQKEAMLRNSQGKKRPWLLKRKESRMQDLSRAQYLFCSIDMKLVSRVLDMAVVSTQQLRWCQERLQNIHLDGCNRIQRRCSWLLFPSS